jgi:hypothetical protein
MLENNDEICNESSLIHLHAERLSCINFINVIIVCDKQRLIRLVNNAAFELNFTLLAFYSLY